MFFLVLSEASDIDLMIFLKNMLFLSVTSRVVEYSGTDTPV